MNKQTSRAFHKKVFLLGIDGDGNAYWLEEGTWDCDWYWGVGYVETYTNNLNPNRSKDIVSHQHFDSMFFNKRVDGHTAFKEFFVKTPLSDKEIWVLVELMKSIYTARSYSDMLHTGGAHYTTNPQRETIQNDTEYKRINEVVIPKLLESVYDLLEN